MVVEVEEQSGPPRWLLPALGVIALVIAGTLASVFIFKLQPPLAVSTSCASGLACISMPPNASTLNFTPINSTVVMGVNNTVMWTNDDSIQHTVVVCPAGGGQLCSPSAAVAASGFLSKGDTFEVTLNATGVYHFYCSIHPGTMRGTIVVLAASASGS